MNKYVGRSFKSRKIMQEKCESCEEEKKINSVMRIDGELKGVCDDCLMMRIKKMD